MEFTLPIPVFNLSHNRIRGQIPNISRIAIDSIIDPSFNQFSGQLPQVSSNVSFLDPSNNSFSRSLFPLLCSKLKEAMGTVFLNLGGNFLSGEIPDCWTNWQDLGILKLDNNRLTGSIPCSMGTLHSLLLLHLQKKHLSVEIPLSLKNCTNLVVLDFGYIPDQLCAIDSLQILDLANNDLSGSLPRCVSNFSAMIKASGSAKTDVTFVIFSGTFVISIMMKGQMLEYSTTLNLVRSIDFSNNSLSGEIPMEVTSLFELQSLNLSHNLLTGKIPKRIGEIRSLESADFSLQSFDPSSYDGNQLCGLPLPEKCSANGTVFRNVGNGGGEHGNGFEIFWFCLGMPFGFVIGFWRVFGPLAIDRPRSSVEITLGQDSVNSRYLRTESWAGMLSKILTRTQTADHSVLRIPSTRTISSISHSYFTHELFPTSGTVQKWRVLQVSAAVAQQEAAATAQVEERLVEEEEKEGEVGTEGETEPQAETEAQTESPVNTKLYFGNLPYNVDSAQLAGIKQDYGSPELVEVRDM
ncbi:hypothetical protein CRYUN_Cryun36dG0080500 [Craigia yunnanensis]